MRFLEWAGHHPWLTALALIIAGNVATAPFKYAFKAFNRAVRAGNIARHGWPKAPMDADGDIVYPKKEEEQ